MKTHWEIFKTFLALGGQAVGGGHTLLPMVQRRLESTRLTPEQLADLVTVAESAPGPFTLKLALAVGYRLGGLRGGLAAGAGVMLVPLMLFTAVAAVLVHCAEVGWVQRFLRGMQPAIVALMALPCYRLGQAARLSLTNIWLPVGTVLAVVWLQVAPFVVLATVGVCAYLYGRFVQPFDSPGGEDGNR